ncbi:MAG: hypothetical protein HLUCCA04_11990 [Oceanicaulis sp. HLUCCA04]|nr:MAG: hypothetical protein HLUCCA04_11990 [Oceanicaulis sp. HLUCCA04]
MVVSVRGPALIRASAPAFSRLRLGAYLCAGMLHAGALGTIALLPPETLDRFIATGTRVEARFFTISAIDAESDLPLNAPLLADRGQTQTGTAEAEGDPSGPDGDTPADDRTPGEAAPEEDASPQSDADTETEQEAEPDTHSTLEPPIPESEDGTLPADPDAQTAPPPPAPAGRSGNAPAAGVVSPDRPVDTIQPEEEEQSFTVRRPPTFAEIEARAETGLRVEDFQIERIEGGVGAAIAEVFCLSSGDTNREIGDCGDGPNAAQAELAIYHIRAISESPLEFAENMSRLEHELNALGVSPSTLDLLRVQFLNAQREQTRRSPLLRAMERDRAAQTDHMGITAPITPQRARDPSGER